MIRYVGLHLTPFTFYKTGFNVCEGDTEPLTSGPRAVVSPCSQPSFIYNTGSPYLNNLNN